MKLDSILETNDFNEANMIPILLATQELSEENYISEDVSKYIASKLGLTLAKLSSVISFYAALSDKPRGKHVIKLCKSTSCLINNYQSLRSILERELGISMGETTPCKTFSLEYTECIGACDISPAFRIDKEIYGNLDEAKIIDLLNKYKGESTWQSQSVC